MSKGNETREAGDFVNVVRDIVRQELTTRDATAIAIVESINQDDTLNLYILPDMNNVVRNIINQSKYTFYPGDTALVYLIGNRLSNSFIIAKCDAQQNDATAFNIDDKDLENTNIIQGLIKTLKDKQDKIIPNNLSKDYVLYNIGFNESGKVVRDDIYSPLKALEGSSDPDTSTDFEYTGQIYINQSSNPKHVFICTNQTNPSWQEITSINGAKGGALRSPLVIEGGDQATASKIVLDQTKSGQITNNGTATLLGFVNSQTTLVVGSNSYSTVLRSSGNNVYIASQNPNNKVVTLETLLNKVYPIGSIYMSVADTSPASFLGGTWTRFGQGRVLVGVDSTDSSFDEPEEQGGEKVHKLTALELPSHRHSVNIGTQTITNDTALVRGPSGTDSGVTLLDSAMITNNNGTLVYTGTRGSNNDHNNLQPYITVYMWKRLE